MRKWIAIAVVAACGGQITTVDGSKNTQTLSPTDQNQLCNDVYNYVKSNFSTNDGMKLGCGFSSATQPNCQQAYNNCLAQSATVDAGAILNGPPDCTGFNQAVAQCNTTVAEYTKCVEQEMNIIKNLEGQMPICGQAALEAADINALQSLSSDCVQLLTSCQLTFSPTPGGTVTVTVDAGTD